METEIENGIEKMEKWDEKEAVIARLRETCYDVDAVIAREEKNWNLFKKHQDLVVPYPKDHPGYYQLAFGTTTPMGKGVLDIGAGTDGTFEMWNLREHFIPPRIAIDPFAVREMPDWQPIIMKGEKILEKFGENSFDFVQCTETLEHVDEDVGNDIAQQMLKVSKKYCLITCCGLSHHLGPINMEKVAKNEFIAYKGQPNIETLMDMGYTVRICANYQIVAWRAQK
jgi:hypothetical protein